MVTPLKITWVTAFVLLTACRSDPIQFHTLTPAQLSGTARGNGGEIQIEGLSVPPQVDRPQIDLGRHREHFNLDAGATA